MIRYKSNNGFTLVELMITVAIIGILAAIAIPRMENSAYKTNRVNAKAVLMQAVGRQEQYYLNNRAYATSLADLKLAAATANLYIDKSGNETTAADATYDITISTAAATCGAGPVYCVVATPKNNQVQDTTCGTLKIMSNSSKTASGTDPSACW